MTGPGWYPDPREPTHRRYWTGERWTRHALDAEGRPTLESEDRDDLVDLAEILPDLDVELILDVGAHVGETVARYRATYPEAMILACEPVTAAYHELTERFADDERVACWQVALDDRDYRGLVTANGTSPKNRLVTTPTGPVETVRVFTGDTFCRRRRIRRINLLKIDAEGADLAVLRGFAGALADQRIDVLQVEAAMSSLNRKHVPFEAFKAYLEPLGYHPFRIYAQLGNPSLRRSDVVFISRRVHEANPRPRHPPLLLTPPP